MLHQEIVYLKLDRKIKIDKKQIKVEDIGKVYTSNMQLANKIKNTTIYLIQAHKKCSYAISVLKVLEQIKKVDSNIEIYNLGETDFIIEYVPAKKSSKLFQIAKTIFVCITIFLGSAFAIMTFNEDASVDKLFALIYKTVMGKEKTGGSLLEIGYCIGLPIGTIVFFNHFSKFKIDNDPTPLQIQMRLHEEEISKAMIENASREGKTIDVD